MSKTALVTGASKGIGEAIARHCAAMGANVILAARNKRALERIVTEIRALGGQALAVQCDVSHYLDENNAVAQAVNKYNRLDILVNNAGLIDPIGGSRDILNKLRNLPPYFVQHKSNGDFF